MTLNWSNLRLPNKSLVSPLSKGEKDGRHEMA
jgi:hypothetical protein